MVRRRGAFDARRVRGARRRARQRRRFAPVRTRRRDSMHDGRGRDGVEPSRVDVRSRDDGDAQRDGGRCGVRVERRGASRRRKLRRDPRDEFSRTRAVRQTRRDANVDSTRARGGRRGGRVRAERALGRARKTNLVPGRRPSVGDDARRDDGVYAQERGEDRTRRRRGRRGPRRRGGHDRRARALRKDARRRGRRSDVHGKDGAGVVPRRGTRRRPTRFSLARAPTPASRTSRCFGSAREPRCRSPPPIRAHRAYT